MEKFINTLDGEWNTDDELTDVPAGDFIDSINTRRPPGLGGREVINGNADLGYTLPGVPLDSTFLGSCEDHFKKTMVFFVKNATADRIVRYWPEEARFDELIVGGPLNFENPIHSAVVVDGRYLIWTDGRSDNGVITGNPPRMIDMDKASLYQKKLTYELHTNNVSLTGTYALTITQLDGTVVSGPTNFHVGTGTGIPAQLDLMVTALAGLGVTATRCGDFLEMEVNTAERRAIITSTTSDILFVGINHYPTTIIEPYISLARYMPKCAPEPFFFNDPALTENKCFGFNFQFRYRYWYSDGYESKWSPVSYVPTNFTEPTPSSTTNDETYNSIRLEFNDDLLTDPDWRSMIDKVEIGVVIDKGLLRSVDTVKVQDLGIDPVYTFVNSAIYPVVPSDETSSDGTQAIGNQEFVPKIASAIEAIFDDSGNYSLEVGGTLEGFDQVNCMDAVIAKRNDFCVAPPASSSTDQSQTSRKLKENGAYDIYVLYEDDYGRQWPAVKVGRFKCDVSTFGNPNLRSIPQVTLNHLPPLEATRWRFAISKNLNQDTYVQFPLRAVNYWRDTGDVMMSTTYAAGNADYVGFNLGRVPYAPINQSILFEDVRRSMLAEDGDRIQVYGIGPSLGANGNYPVAGYNLTNPAGTTPPFEPEDYTIFIRFDSSQPDHTISPAVSLPVLELYRQSSVEDLAIQELPDCYDVVDAGLPTRNHGGMKEILWGDAFERNVSVEGNRILCETPSLYEKNNIYASDQGRVTVADEGFKEVFDYSKIRSSGIYSPGTFINGLPSFKGIDFIKVSRDIGAVQRLEYVRSILLAICQFGTHPIYVGSDQVIDFRGNSLVGISNSLLNLAPDVLMYGTHDPLSIINTGQYVFGWDGYLGVPWRYSVGGGIDDISRKNKKFFNAISKNHFEDRDTVIVRAGLQREFGGFYYLTFRDSGVGLNETVMFSIGRGAWDGRCSFSPELYGSVGLNFYAFQVAKVWEQDGGSPGTFFGGRIGNEAELAIVVNPDPSAQKLFWNIDEQADTLWWSPEITIENSVPGGMMTRIKQARWKRYEGHWYAEIPRDMNDPNPIFVGINGPIQALNSGRRMRGDVMVVKLRLDDSTILSKLRSVKSSYSKS